MHIIITFDDDQTVGDVFAFPDGEDARRVYMQAMCDVAMVVREVQEPPVWSCDECGAVIYLSKDSQSYQHKNNCSLHTRNEVRT